MKLRRFIAVLLVLGVLLSTMGIGFGASGVEVEKVVFRNLSTNLDFIGLGGVRFYNSTGMIDSGAVLNNARTSGVTEQFAVNTDGGYDGNNYYYAVHPLDTSKPQLGDYTERCYWIADQQSGRVTIDFKNSLEVNKIEFVPLPDSILETRGVTEPFVIDVYATDGSMTSYDITPITENNTVQTLVLTTASSDLTLDIQSDTYTLNAGETVEVDVVLSNATDIYAEDVTVQYDSSAFTLLSEDVDSVSYQILHNEKSSGQARYIIASNGADYGINGEDGILTLTFQAKNYDGEADITVLNGLVADSQGNELTPELLGKTFTISGGYTDVNGDDVFSLGDLAIASNLLATDSSEWGSFTPDIDTNGAVENADLTAIVTEILK